MNWLRFHRRLFLDRRVVACFDCSAPTQRRNSWLKHLKLELKQGMTTML